MQDSAKSIAETERKLASLSGSTSQADIAERRRLQKTLYDQRNELETSYRDNARDAQLAALEEEQTAYEDATTRYIETLKTTLKNASKETSDFMSKVSTLVMSNADIVLKKYQETGLVMDEALTHPWEVAIDKLEEFGGPAGLGVMNSWTTKGGFFDTFMNTASMQLQTPWMAGAQAVQFFGESVANAMYGIATSIASNVSNVTSNLGPIVSAYEKIRDTALSAAAAMAAAGGGFGGWNNGSNSGLVTASLNYGNGTGISATGSTQAEAKNALMSAFYKSRENSGDTPGEITRSWNAWISHIQYTKYAKGIVGTKKDEFAITDEYGPELTLVPTDAGNLSFMRAGTGVIPADLTKSLMDIGAVGLDGLMNANQLNSGINIINTAVTKPNYEFSFDALVKADHIDENAVPALKKMVTEELDKFAKQLNYAIKKV